MIKVLLNGCNGKMGKVVTSSAKSFSDIEIVAGVDKSGEQLDNYPVFQSLKDCTIPVDVVIDFSRADAIYDLINYCKKNNSSIIVCSTGFSEDALNFINDASKEIAIFRSANMSIGINVLSAVLKKVSPYLYNDFDIEIVEKHHNQKVDAPSGTAILLADVIKDSLESEPQYIYGREGSPKRSKGEIGLHAIRGGNIVGDHEVIFAGAGEVLEFTHKAISREVFAQGALKAAMFMKDKKSGLYNMDDMINLNNI